NRDKLKVSSVMYTTEQADVVIMQTDTFDGNLLVKRVVATGGQTVDIDFDAGIVYVDGQPLQEDYTAELTYVREDFQGEVLVPEGYVFVMGDNRNHSSDSRSDRVGVVDARRIIGKAYLLIPVGQQTNIYGEVVGGRDWGRFGSVRS
ncbi:MAG: signal peptidase I, partial [Oscillospiraceae bacterium]|nr:signal peptidase I [Oscillospiraceae bacterium]